MSNSDLRFIGMGNEHRRDDGVGIFIVRHPALLQRAGAQVSESQRDGTHLMDLWKGAATVFVFDAVYSGGIPGTVYRLDPINAPLPGKLFQASAHTLGIPEAVELSRKLNQLPARLIFYGIEGRNFGQGQSLSRPCKLSALKVVQQVLKEILF